MIEIALCLAIIGFALVAIIGVLPFGMNVQKENRQETIIDQDAQVWMDAIRSGARGYDDLTNYVVSITNYWTQYSVNKSGVLRESLRGINSYWRSNSVDFGSHITSDTIPENVFPLTNGAKIIGLLSTPKWLVLQSRREIDQSNYFVAYVRAMSGDMVEKPPQTNDIIRDNAFAYKMIVEVQPYVNFDTNATNFAYFTPGSSDWIARSNYMQTIRVLTNDSHDIRLTFRWPLLPNGDIGNGWQTFRVLTGGQLTNDPPTSASLCGTNLFFFQSSIYGQAQ